MKIQALNCPNCGAGVASDKTQCQFCKTRLKTVACSFCLGLMFEGSAFCSLCGGKTAAAVSNDESAGSCPRCKVRLNALQIEDVGLRECNTCDGLWADVATFETICADRERQAAVLRFISEKHEIKNQKVNYVPCPDCRQLMNRSNFARSSGVIIDICKEHGVWFDADELPNIIEFIHKGGLDIARQKEKQDLQDQIDRLKDEQRKTSAQQVRYEGTTARGLDPAFGIREFISGLFD